MARGVRLARADVDQHRLAAVATLRGPRRAAWPRLGTGALRPDDAADGREGHEKRREQPSRSQCHVTILASDRQAGSRPGLGRDPGVDLAVNASFLGPVRCYAEICGLQSDPARTGRGTSPRSLRRQVFVSASDQELAGGEGSENGTEERGGLARLATCCPRGGIGGWTQSSEKRDPVSGQEWVRFTRRTTQRLPSHRFGIARPGHPNRRSFSSRAPWCDRPDRLHGRPTTWVTLIAASVGGAT